jgi:drug/metabolite transporter (DMT)-like permease
VGAVDPSSWLAFGYLVVVGSLVAYSAYVWLLAHAPVSLVTTYAYVNPAVAVALGALFLDEPLSPPVLVGGAVIIAAVAVVISTEARNLRRQQQLPT